MLSVPTTRISIDGEQTFFATWRAREEGSEARGADAAPLEASEGGKGELAVDGFSGAGTEPGRSLEGRDLLRRG